MIVFLIDTSRGWWTCVLVSSLLVSGKNISKSFPVRLSVKRASAYQKKLSRQARRYDSFLGRLKGFKLTSKIKFWYENCVHRLQTTHALNEKWLYTSVFHQYVCTWSAWATSFPSMVYSLQFLYCAVIAVSHTCIVPISKTTCRQSQEFLQIGPAGANRGVELSKFSGLAFDLFYFSKLQNNQIFTYDIPK